MDLGYQLDARLDRGSSHSDFGQHHADVRRYATDKDDDMIRIALTANEYMQKIGAADDDFLKVMSLSTRNAP